MNILVISTYPVERASHGGQIRVLNLIEHYKQIAQRVSIIGVLGAAHYPKADGFIAYPGSDLLTKYLPNPFLMEDWALGRLLVEDDFYFSQLAAKATFTPDVMHVEHPWLFAFAERLRREKGWSGTKILYGSANIEHELKYKILLEHFPLEHVELAAEKIKACEIYALEHCDAVACVSENDVKFSELYAKGPVILAQNGVDSAKASLSEVIEGSRVSGNHKYALFCASAHPPNMTGFFDMFRHGLGFLKPNERLVCAGSVGDAVAGDKRGARTTRISYLINAGVVTDGCLRGLIHNAHVIILPITVGGGTNLKTAEALWSGAHVVATTSAMRGYESFVGRDGVHVHDDPQAFVKAVQACMDLPRLALSAEEFEIRRAVLWERTLAGLMAFLSKWQGS